jgi:hypothetical protein
MSSNGNGELSVGNGSPPSSGGTNAGAPSRTTRAIRVSQTLAVVPEVGKELDGSHKTWREPVLRAKGIGIKVKDRPERSQSERRLKKPLTNSAEPKTGNHESSEKKTELILSAIA